MKTNVSSLGNFGFQQMGKKKKEWDKISAYRTLKSGRAELRRWQI